MTGVGSGASPSVLGRPSSAQFQLRVHLFQGRNLPATDNNGLADPYVIVRCCGKKLKFDKRPESLNPRWFETKIMNVQLPVPLPLAPHIQVFVFDWDATSKDDPMGRFSIPVTDALDMNPSSTEIRPRWYDLVSWENKPVEEAQMLMSFELLTASEVEAGGATVPSIVPPTIPMTLELTTLGLRDLAR